MLFLFLGGALHAADLPAPVTLDLPTPANKALPTWLGQPITPPTAFATLDLPILAPDTSSSLLVTVYFKEKPGGFMRVTWTGTQGAQVLSPNFYEGIGMANQRSLLISPATLIGDGTLTFQSSDSTLGIQRVKLEWLTNKETLVSPEVQDMLVTPAVGPTQPSLTLSGQPVATEPGAWQNQLVTVPITDDAERIEEGVEFSIDLDQPPGAARVKLDESGLPLGKHLVVWINEKRAGTITPAVPDLLDGGYITNADAPKSDPAKNYFGWRDGSFYVPVSLLQTGVNSIQFSTEDDANLTPDATPAAAAAGDPPLAIKNFVMQLDYTAAASAPLAPAVPNFLVTQPSLNTGPIAPDDPTPTGPLPQ